MDRTKQGGKGKIVVAAFPQFFKIFSSLVLFMWVWPTLCRKKKHSCKSLPISVCLRNNLLFNYVSISSRLLSWICQLLPLLCKLYALMSGKKNVTCFIVGFDIDTKSHQCYRDNFQPVVVVPILPILPLYMLNQSRFFRISFVSLLERCMLIWYVSETKKKDFTRISVCFSLCVIKVLCWFHSSAYWCWSMAVAVSETKGNWIFFFNKLNCVAEVSN